MAVIRAPAIALAAVAAAACATPPALASPAASAPAASASLSTQARAAVPAPSAWSGPLGTAARRRGTRRAGLYGGGAFGRFVQFVTVRLKGGRTKADELATLTTRCPGFSSPLFDNIRVTDVAVAKGRFTRSQAFTETVPAGIPEIGGLRRSGTISVGTAIGFHGRAVGTIRNQFTLRDPRTGAVRANCDTGRVRFAARIPARRAGRGKPAPPRGASLFGTTAQKLPFLLRVSRRARSVERAGMTLQVACPSALGRPIDLVATSMRIGRGRFGATGAFTRHYTTPQFGPVLESYRWRLRGRFGSLGAAGTWRVSATVRRLDTGAQVGTCGTGRNRWRAVR